MRKVLYILGELEDSDLQWIVDAGSLRSLGADEVMIREGGGELDSLFIVVEGELIVSTAGNELARLSIGEVVGEMSLLDSRPPNATVTAGKPTLVYEISRAALHKKLGDDQGFGKRFYRALCIFLANRLGRTDLLVGATAARTPTQENVSAELSPDVLENMTIAGARFDWFLQRVRGSVAT